MDLLEPAEARGYICNLSSESNRKLKECFTNFLWRLLVSRIYHRFTILGGLTDIMENCCAPGIWDNL